VEPPSKEMEEARSTGLAGQRVREEKLMEVLKA
jgi:hypothetical protein